MSYRLCARCNNISDFGAMGICEYCGYSLRGFAEEYIYDHNIYKANYSELLNASDVEALRRVHSLVQEGMNKMETLDELCRELKLSDGREKSIDSEVVLRERLKEAIWDMIDNMNPYLKQIKAGGACHKIPIFIFNQQIDSFAEEVYRPYKNMYKEGTPFGVVYRSWNAEYQQGFVEPFRKFRKQIMLVLQDIILSNSGYTWGDFA